ncbi:single-strand binding protein [Oscillochloris trichoides DG-6]|uniref:Single-stranded DNA-binding protein n=1 Tax=Oscillochloris trichoides DG-6 TaxID=765420 RepID=E1IBE6_9CHLR|nr:single-stranded DNA-binding protein [Oscillochloris trichoides]EFO81503.1 single-strand binding protein [Oscillochloris trichoides DG-6]
MHAVKGTLNRVDLIGHLGADPEMRFLSSGKAVCRFNIATNRISGQNEQGQRNYETEWTQIEAWEQLAEQCNSYLHKGRKVLISGSLRTDSWTDKESGQTRYRTYVRAREVLFLDARSDQSSTPAEVGAQDTDDELPF